MIDGKGREERERKRNIGRRGNRTEDRSEEWKSIRYNSIIIVIYNSICIIV